MAKRHHFNRNICASSNIESTVKRSYIFSNYKTYANAMTLVVPEELQKQTEYKIEDIAILS